MKIKKKFLFSQQQQLTICKSLILVICLLGFGLYITSMTHASSPIYSCLAQNPNGNNFNQFSVNDNGIVTIGTCPSGDYCDNISILNDNTINPCRQISGCGCTNNQSLNGDFWCDNSNHQALTPIHRQCGGSYPMCVTGAIQPGNAPWPCTGGSTDACANVTQGRYCGGANGNTGTSGTLYTCDNSGKTTQTIQCPNNNCVIEPNPTPDECRPYANCGGAGEFSCTVVQPDNSSHIIYSDSVQNPQSNCGKQAAHLNGFPTSITTVYCVCGEQGGAACPSNGGNSSSGSNNSSGGGNNSSSNSSKGSNSSSGGGNGNSSSGNSSSSSSQNSNQSSESSLSSSSSSSVPPGDAYVSLAIQLPGVGNINGGNPHPNHPTRQVVLYLYTPDQNPANVNDKPITIKTTITLNTSLGNSLYGYFVNPKIAVGHLFGDYQIFIKANQYIRTSFTDKQSSNNLFTLTPQQTVALPPTTLIAGDIFPPAPAGSTIFGDNVLDISDYNMLISCYGNAANTAICPSKSAADLYDDGNISGIDYNILLRSFALMQNH